MPLVDTQKRKLQLFGEKIGLDLEYFTKNGFWVFLRYGSFSLVGLLLSISLARLLPKEILGQYQFVLTTITFLGVFSLPGLHTFVLRESVRGNRGVIHSAYRVSLSWGLIIIGVTSIYGLYQIFQGQLALGGALIFAGLLAPLFYAANMWYAVYEGKLNFRTVTIRLVGSQALYLLVMLAILFFTRSLIVIVGAHFFFQGITRYFFYRVTSRDFVDQDLPIDYSFVIKTSLQRFTQNLSETIPVFAITFLFGYEAVAEFQVSMIFFLVFSSFIGSMSGLYFPLLFRENGPHSIFRKGLIVNCAVGLVCAGGYFILVKLFLTFLYGEVFATSQILALTFTPLVFLIPLRTFLINFSTAAEENILLISCYLLSNLFALLILWTFKGDQFMAIVLYVYGLNSIAVALMLFARFRRKRITEGG